VEANWGTGGSERVRAGEKVDHRRAAGPPPRWTCLGDTALGARVGIASCGRRKWMPLEGKGDTDKVGPVGKGEGVGESAGCKFCYVTALWNKVFAKDYGRRDSPNKPIRDVLGLGYQISLSN
jgi:hypothetical protein